MKAALRPLAVTAAGRELLASVRVAAPIDRVYRALASSEVTSWWVRPGVFDTRAWSGDVRVGGRWRASGLGRGQPYVLEGEFLEVQPPTRLVHTWTLPGATAPASTVTYKLSPMETGTVLHIEHGGFSTAEACSQTAAGWESSLEALMTAFDDPKRSGDDSPIRVSCAPPECLPL